MANVYLNGSFIPLDDAKIPVLDRGFTFGDGVYEVFLVYRKRIICFDEHLDRLNNSLAAIYMENPLGRDEWFEVLDKLVQENPASDQSLYLQVTRGCSERDHDINLAGKPTVFAMSKALPERNLDSGIKAITCEDIRWKLCHIKAITLLPSILLRHQARLAGAREAILVRDGLVTEGAASNVFIVRAGTVKTPPKDGSLLPGITRDLLVELLNKNGIECRETRINNDDLLKADEIWITSSTWEIVPVIMLNDVPVGEGAPGPVWKQAVGIYSDFKASV
ncbi:MAG TPA: D-amino acid aminotransferase [Gammaproteobacteria bacterium]|nr:D-amino acid aminotransferase [Gammaproteobacteria bacterium]